MEVRAYQLMADHEARHWWWCGRRAILRRVLQQLAARRRIPPGVLYDLGCGVGSNLPVLAEFGRAVGYDGAAAAVEAARAKGLTDVHLADITAGLAALREIPGPGAVALLADVIEHLEDESPALALAQALLVPGGLLIVTVPALPALWGPADEFNHHRRRYTPRTLREVVGRYFTVQRVTFFNSVLFPAIAAARLLSNVIGWPGIREVEVPPAPLNALLRAVFSAEAWLVPSVRLPLGVSLLCVGTRNG